MQSRRSRPRRRALAASLSEHTALPELAPHVVPAAPAEGGQPLFVAAVRLVHDLSDPVVAAQPESCVVWRDHEVSLLVLRERDAEHARGQETKRRELA